MTWLKKKKKLLRTPSVKAVIIDAQWLLRPMAFVLLRQTVYVPSFLTQRSVLRLVRTVNTLYTSSRSRRIVGEVVWKKSSRENLSMVQCTGEGGAADATSLLSIMEILDLIKKIFLPWNFEIPGRIPGLLLLVLFWNLCRRSGAFALITKDGMLSSKTRNGGVFARIAICCAVILATAGVRRFAAGEVKLWWVTWYKWRQERLNPSEVTKKRYAVLDETVDLALNQYNCSWLILSLLKASCMVTETHAESILNAVFHVFGSA